MRSLVALAITLPALLIAAPAAAVAAGDAISVTVSDEVDEATPGDTVRYTVVVENAGDQPFSGTVNLRVPEFVELGASDATVGGGVASWSAEIPAQGSAKFQAVILVGEVPEDAYQVVTLAEVVDPRGGVVVRAADANEIPGAQRPADVPGLTAPTAHLPEWLMPAGILAAVILAAVSLATFGMLMARRKRPRTG